jgi:hypothetical protein
MRGLCFRMWKPTHLHRHKRDLDSSSRSINPAKMHSKTTPTHLGGCAFCTEDFQLPSLTSMPRGLHMCGTRTDLSPKPDPLGKRNAKIFASIMRLGRSLFKCVDTSSGRGNLNIYTATNAILIRAPKALTPPKCTAKRPRLILRVVSFGPKIFNCRASQACPGVYTSAVPAPTFPKSPARFETYKPALPQTGPSIELPRQ